MQENEIQGESEDQLIDLIGIYGEANLIKYLSESLINKDRIMAEHEQD